MDEISNLAALRVQAGMKQAELAEAMRQEGQAHWYQTTVSRVEHGTQKLRPDEAHSLQKVLGLAASKKTNDESSKSLVMASELIKLYDSVEALRLQVAALIEEVGPVKATHHKQEAP